MKVKELFTYFTVGAGIFLFFTVGYAEQTPSVEYGEYLSKSDDRWDGILGSDFLAEEAVVLPLNERLFVLYGNEDDWSSYFSFLHQQQEQILWTFTDYIFRHWQVKPTLTGGFLNANESLDFVICYSLGTGPGSGGESGETTLVLVLDEQPVTGSTFEISAYSIQRCRRNEEDCVRSETVKSGSALLFPESKSGDWTLYLRFSIENNSQETYQLVEYRIRENQATKINTIEGGKLHISGLLRSIVFDRREHGETPIFLTEDGKLIEERHWWSF